MAYGDDCYAGAEALRDAESARQYARDVERQLHDLQNDYRAEVRLLREEIRELRGDVTELYRRYNENPANV